jgi:CRISPR-associated endonuclease/helicase Cas3
MSILAKSTGGKNSAGETLAEHTIRCLQIANIILKSLPFTSNLRKEIAKDLRIALATHDVGKAATGFQRSLQKDGPKWGRRHEILSAAFASSLGLKDEVILAILTHHKSLPSNGITSITGCLPDEQIPFAVDHLYPVWVEMAEEWNQNLPLFVNEWAKICKAIHRQDLVNSISLIPLCIDRSWLDRDTQSKDIRFQNRYYASVLRGLLISCDHIASNNSVNKAFIPANIPVLKKYSLVSQDLRGFQKSAGEKKGNLVLRSPTGSGKTLAALLWAQNNQKKNGRLFYVLPNIASINAMYLRLKGLFGEQNVGLLHSRASSSLYSILEQDSDPSSKIDNQRIARLFNSLTREMWFPIRVCTPHQILRYTLQGKSWETMLSEFPNSCFIFDEIHAYNPTITGLTIATAKYLTEQNATCMFISATLPEYIKNILEDEISSVSFVQPLREDTGDREILSQKRHNLEFVDGNILYNIDFVIKEAKRASSTLVVCNHVPSAQIIYEELSKSVNDVVLLHSQFHRRDRNKIEQSITKSLPKVLVSTQVVEVSLDIDFEQGFSEPAPIDALVQRLGRVNRYSKRTASRVTIFREQMHPYNIYAKELVDRSLEELSSLPNPIGEEDLINAANRIYEDGYTGENKLLYERVLNHVRIRNFQRKLVAGTHQDWVEEVIDEKEGTVDLLPESLLYEYNKWEQMGLKIESDSLLVPVGRWRLGYLNDSIVKSHDLCIIKKPYSAKMGLELGS